MCFYSQFYDKSRVNCIFCFYIKLASAVIVIWKNVGKKFLLVQIDQCTKVQNEHFFSGGVRSGVGQGTQMLKIVSHFHYIKPQFQSQFTQISDLTSTNFLKKGLLSNHSNAFRTKKKNFRTSLCAMTRKKKYAKGLVSIDKIPTRCFGPIFVKKSQKVMRI